MSSEKAATAGAVIYGVFVFIVSGLSIVAPFVVFYDHGLHLAAAIILGIACFVIGQIFRFLSTFIDWAVLIWAFVLQLGSHGFLNWYSFVFIACIAMTALNFIGAINTAREA